MTIYRSVAEPLIRYRVTDDVVEIRVGGGAWKVSSITAEALAEAEKAGRLEVLAGKSLQKGP